MKSTRPYVMRARADAKLQTRQRILAAVMELAEETLDLDPTLDAVAGRAEVSVQTVLRHFGSRDGLFDAAFAAGTGEVAEERAVPAGDVAAAVRVIIEHYERRGDFVLRMLGREHADARVARVVELGRGLHRDWVAAAFGPLLPPTKAAREEATDLLVVATDVFTWKLLRRDRGLPVAIVERRMERFVRAVLGSSEGEA